MNPSPLPLLPSGAVDSPSSKRFKTFVIQEKCYDNGIGLAWSRGNKFSLYPRSQSVSKTETETQAKENKILNLQQRIILFNPILRKLVNESNGTYLALQKVAEAAKNGDNQVEFLKLSRQYRSTIRACLEGLQEAASKESDGISKNNLLSYITILYSIECIWHLCEILYIGSIPGDVVLPYLLEWVRFHFPCHEQTAAQMLEACERGSEDHPQYWETVLGMVVQGRVDVARALLKLHSASESNEFKLVDNSLRSMPTYSVYGGVSSGEFTITWKHWQAECRSKITSGVVANQQQLELIMKLIIGDYSAWEKVRGHYSSWFDVLGGWVLFSCPSARRRELRAAAAACAGMRAPAYKRTQLDVIVRALLDDDLHQVIHEIQQMSDNGWFATHLTDMLYHCGQLTILDKQQNNVTARLRESLILEYGATLMEHSSLWTAGVSYLASVPGAGTRRADQLLARMPLHTHAKALRVLAEADKYGLHGVVQTICGVMCTRAIAAGRLDSALAWGARRGADGGAMAARAALKAYAQGAALPRGTAAPQPLHPIATLAAKYCEFHELYKSREFKNAAKLLVSLITSNLAPDYFWEILLLDSLPLLEADEPVFSMEDTFALMSCLELKGQFGPKGERAELLRLALARNLARTSLQHGHPADQSTGNLSK